MLGTASLLLWFRGTWLWSIWVQSQIPLSTPTSKVGLCFSAWYPDFILFCCYGFALGCYCTRRFGCFIAFTAGLSNTARCRRHF